MKTQKKTHTEISSKVEQLRRRLVKSADFAPTRSHASRFRQMFEGRPSESAFVEGFFGLFHARTRRRCNQGGGGGGEGG